MEISPISGALGAEISGIDISKKLTNTETQLLQENFLKFKVLFFRNQNLSAQTFVSFAKHFGDPTIYPFIKGLDDTPEVIEIIKTKDDKKILGILAFRHKLYGMPSYGHALVCKRNT